MEIVCIYIYTERECVCVCLFHTDKLLHYMFEAVVQQVEHLYGHSCMGSTCVERPIDLSSSEDPPTGRLSHGDQWHAPRRGDPAVIFWTFYKINP